MAAVDTVIQVPEKTNGIEVFLAAASVGKPFVPFAVVVQIHHVRNSVHAKAVEVILIQPEQRTAEQEAADLGTPVVENSTLPDRMVATARIWMIVKVSA